MCKIYFIDSENVGDNWISLLNTIAPEDELLVFFTAKSPHMNYKYLILLKQSPKEVTFIECCEGNNALDFQLCTELGYRVNEMPDNEFIIVSNDTGFDAVVKYWNHRNIPVKRIQGKACAAQHPSVPMPKPVMSSASGNVQTSGTAAVPAVAVSTNAACDTTAASTTALVCDTTAASTTAPASDTAAVSTNAQTSGNAAVSTNAQTSGNAVFSKTAPVSGNAPVLATETESVTKQSSNVIDVRAKEILYIMGKENLQVLHEALQQLFGHKKGQTYYNAFKADTSYSNYISKHEKLNPAEKQNSYCSIVFELSDTDLTMPEDFSKFVTDTWKNKKNLNSFRASLQSRYGKEKSDKYSSLIKAHVKILDKIK